MAVIDGLGMRLALQALLRDVQARGADDFTGIGVIVSDGAVALPVVPLRAFQPVIGSDVASSLASYCVSSSPFHDGFHVLDTSLRIISIANYFSPPIVPGLKVDQSKLVGGRYVAALFGSALPGVVLTGIASRELGVSVFQGGVEVLSEAGAC